MIKNGPSFFKGSNRSSSCAEPLCLVITPTRELADQVYKEARKFTFNTGISIVKVFGGNENYKSQMFDVKLGCDILIATPGRLIDFCSNGYISLKYVKWFILDEADRMLDMGFEKQLIEISEKCGVFFKKTYLQRRVGKI